MSASCPDAQVHTDEREPNAAAGPYQPLRILIAEDNAVNQKLLLRILQNLGHTGEVAETGRQAVRLAKKNRYDAIFMDIQMPELDGIEAAKEIILSFGNKPRPSIVAMTANVLKEEKERCLAAGMDGFIAKPLKINKLREQLAHLAAKDPVRLRETSP